MCVVRSSSLNIFTTYGLLFIAKYVCQTKSQKGKKQQPITMILIGMTQPLSSGTVKENSQGVHF